MPEDSVPYPAHSIWGKLSISFAATSCAVFLLFLFYKLIRKKCFIFCESHLLLRIWYRRNIPYENNPDDPSLDFESRGLAADIVASIQTVQYEDEVKDGDGGNGSSDCTICLQEFGEGEWLRVLPHCLHEFHVQCVDAWLRSHSDCPLCRKQVKSDVGDSCTSLIAMPASLEILPREDFQRPLNHRLLETEAMQNEMLMSEARGGGIRSLMWL